MIAQGFRLKSLNFTPFIFVVSTFSKAMQGAGLGPGQCGIPSQSHQILNDLLDSSHHQDKQQRHQSGPATGGRHIWDLLKETKRRNSAEA